MANPKAKYRATTQLIDILEVTDAIAERNLNLQFQDEGVDVGTKGGIDFVNFTGAGVTADSFVAGTLIVDIPAETATSLGDAINAAGAATPNNTDFVATAESGGLLKKITWTNVKAFLKTYFDTVYQAVLSGASLTAVTVATNDKVLIQDTSDSNNLKTVTTQAIADLALATSGTYTPVRSAEVNLDSNPTLSDAFYLKIGSYVVVSGQFTADPTTPATQTRFDITLPVASNFGAITDLSGTAVCGTIAGMSGAIQGSAANDTARIFWIASDITSQTWSYQYGYKII